MLVSKMTRWDMNGKNKDIIPVMSEDLELVTRTGGETGDATGGAQSVGSSTLDIEVKEAILTVDISRKLERESIFSLVNWVESQLGKVGSRAIAEVGLNGQGATTATQDNGYATKKLVIFMLVLEL